MSKYIDTEKLLADIERLNSLVSYESEDRHNDGLHDAYKAVKNIITSLQQEQPSLPDNLDEVVEKYANTHYGEFFEVEYDFGDPIEVIVDDKPFVRDAFKAGAEWMAKQGETIFDTIVIDGQGQRWLTDNLLLGDYDCGEEVIVQIRKK